MKILRKKYEADVCEELVRPAMEEKQTDPRQGQLWQTPLISSSNTSMASLSTVKSITRDALKILEDEMYKNNKPTKLIT
jgi:hypothetical protein